ncbi:MAG: manganese efflux pump MntP family protein [Firmicutes bacterium]|nr:manganese efflux pump MntP family protein [Bacillota bacterium]
MELDFSFFAESVLLGVGLAMDAFSVSMANGLNEPKMKAWKMLGISGSFAFFQALMPMTGWIIVHTAVETFDIIEGIIPWVSLILLSIIGGKMVYEGIKGGGEDAEKLGLGLAALLAQDIATSIDALSVGFTIADYDVAMALIASLIIAVVTFAICTAGHVIGRKFGTRLSGKASVFGGVILILIGLEICISGILG